jgi:hypothetical protein
MNGGLDVEGDPQVVTMSSRDQAVTLHGTGMIVHKGRWR